MVNTVIPNGFSIINNRSTRVKAYTFNNPGANIAAFPTTIATLIITARMGQPG